jgi:hypothetical protein
MFYSSRENLRSKLKELQLKAKQFIKGGIFGEEKAKYHSYSALMPTFPTTSFYFAIYEYLEILF